MEPLPEAGHVLPLLGASPVADEAVIARLLGRAASTARTVTGGVGFGSAGTVEREIADILVRSVARSLLNPELSLIPGEEPFTDRPGGFAAWSDADYLLLASYRVQRSSDRVD